MKSRWLLVCALVAALSLQGCAAGRRYIDKPWGKGTWIPAAICSVAGAGVGYWVQEERVGTSTVVIKDSSGNVLLRKSKTDDAEHWKGALVGAAIGFAACALAGHYFFDPDVVEPTPIPPPPPTPTPSPESLPAPSAKRLVLRGVNFDYDKSDIRPDSRPVLDEAADVLDAHQGVRVSVEGHTDSRGSDAYNEKLSVRRAEAVFRYLVNRGVAPDRMEVIGYGETRPIADNESDTGRAENRRVELHVVKGTENQNGDSEAVPAPESGSEPAAAPAAENPAAGAPVTE